MGPTVRALLVRLGVKDDYTAEHTRGVALRAVQVGEELGLAPVRAARAGGRRAAPRRGQARGAERDPPEAGRAHGRRVRRDQAASRGRQRAGARAGLLEAGGAAGARPPRAARRHAATRAGWARRTSTSRPASWPSATSSTRCSRSGSTATPGGSRTRSSYLSKESGTKFDPACVDALERVIAREQADSAAPRRLSAGPPSGSAQLAGDRPRRARRLLAHVAEGTRSRHIAHEPHPRRCGHAGRAHAASRFRRERPDAPPAARAAGCTRSRRSPPRVRRGCRRRAGPRSGRATPRRARPRCAAP